MRRGSKLTEEHRAKISRALKGRSLSEETKALISRATGGPTPEQVDLAVAAYEAGYTLREIAKMIGVSHMTVKRHLLRRGVKMRQQYATDAGPRVEAGAGY